MEYNKLIELARLHGSHEEWDKSIYYFEKAFIDYPNNIIITDLLELGLVFAEVGNETKAIDIMNEVIEYDKSNYIGYHYLGLCYMRLNESSKALEAFLDSFLRDDKTEECLFNIGLLYDEAGNKEKAVKFYLETLVYNAENFYANLNLGAIYQENNELDLALERAFIAHKAFPDKHLACYNIAVAYGLMGKFDEALKYYQEEVTKEDFCIDAYYNIGVIYKDRKEYEIAKNYYLKAISHNKSDFKYWYNLACVYSLMNDFENAYDCLYYSKYLNNKIINYLESDEDLKEFVKTEYYKNLVK